MDKDTRNAIERATQRARKLLEEDFAAQLEGDFDVQKDGEMAAKAGKHLSARQAFQRERIVAAIEHKRAAGMSTAEAARDYLRDAAFTALNRFVALKMLEARELVQECITKGDQSAGYREFCGMAPGLPLLPDSAGYRLYIESLFDELSTEVKVLFDRRDPSSVLWPKRATFEELLEILNAAELGRVWGEDETIGWVYQFFNGQDERRKMREESQAPRNSRELAVRNQFFTPRYVVQFLTDNTLGRIWYEMRGIETVLAEKCEYMVRRPGEGFAPRAKKDPRDLRVLDPACGSGHFLLYAFDLLLAIYEEAHADPESPNSEATGKALAEDYPSLDVLRKAVPRLVLAHNLHGVDIDPRCAQIAQLALWMRAQKAYRDFGIGRAERAQIRRSNIVVAEPLVADEQIAKEFVAKLGDAELGRVFTSLVESLNLAGDLGLLQRVEQLVARQGKRGQTGDLFAPPEERIRAALDRFAREDASATNMRRRLFADDAAHGVALLCVAETKFDVVLMNPPFGAGSMRAKRNFEKAYPRTKNDVYAAFVERSLELIHEEGRIGALTSRTGFFLKSFREWREETLLTHGREMILADLGIGVLDDAMVETAAYTIGKGTCSTFIRLTSEASKGDALLASVARSDNSGAQNIHCLSLQEFRAVEGAPFSYWLATSVRRLFRALPPFESEERFARLGASTKDDFRFLRLWWEVPLGSVATAATETEKCRWVTFAKGGPSTPFYSELSSVVNWAYDGHELKAFISAYRESHGWGDHWRAELHNSDYYFREGITWPLRASAFCPQILPSGCIFSVRGYAVLAPSDQLLPLVGLLSSSAFDFLFKSLLGRFGFPEFVVGALQKLPIPELSTLHDELGRLARDGWLASRRLVSMQETAREFVAVDTGRQRRQELDATLAATSSRLDALGLAAYSLSQSDIALAIEEPNSDTVERTEPAEDDEPYCATGERATPSISWVLGVSFGRFDPRLATGERPIPPVPEPFDPLPSRSPGMYPEGEEPAERPDIRVDDEGHADDLVARVLAVAERVHVDVPENLRGWLAKEFFPLHIKMYSKSRRKAPIYWQLATPSASYSAWLYIHAFSRDTLFRVQNDYAAPKLAHEERRLESITSDLRDGATAAQRKALAAQEAFVEELRAFLDEVKRIAPLWNPNLDDGVILNFAPLWRLVPQNKSWQKELKSTWDSLCEGKYDWAHLAMHLWPERVVPKCAKDRSLAIAHGLEDVFWIAGTDGKWTARKTPTRSADELVRERTSPAVKSALKSLLEAPVASGAAKKTKKGKANA
ncbi:BREX-1 system adenine-specific DNA-methyltransferase PglX [Sorangium sp. So ce1504]|uniref:BREX-1 system adenine-specific DNA-methyltransferase PglX n=1 Tax=Sorangium sp. So ce1504 TaxID=3133337 RepID=UPI003F625A84